MIIAAKVVVYMFKSYIFERDHHSQGATLRDLYATEQHLRLPHSKFSASRFV